MLRALIMLVTTVLGWVGTEPGTLRPTELRCEYRVEPLGVEASAPRLSWVLESPGRSQRQTAYRVCVASTPARLEQEQPDLWDSGKVLSDRTSHVEYKGRALASGQRCWWRVRAWDRDGREGPWSGAASWEMGLLSPSDWTAEWIDAVAPDSGPAVRVVRALYETLDGKVSKDVTDVVAAIAAKGGVVEVSNRALGGDPAPQVVKRLRVEYAVGGDVRSAEAKEGSTLTLKPSPLPLLRRAFMVPAGVVRARIRATALGVYELSLNGQPLGLDHLNPGWTDYAKRVRYQTYDVTTMLRPGKNVLGAWVGPGWFCGRAGLFGARRYWGESPAFRMQLDMDLSDGTTRRVISDEQWRVRAGPMESSDIMEGEVYDSRAFPMGWTAPTYDDREWSPAKTRAETRTLQADVDAPVRELETLSPIDRWRVGPAAWVYDLGQNMVGVVRLKVACAAGTRITLRHAEVLNADRTMYTANLRGAPSTDTYVASGPAPGRSEELWQPRFTFHGFRYVEVSGLEADPGPDAVTGVVLGSDLARAGEFECSNKDLNQLEWNIRWGLKGNYLSVPTDCPQRDERMGWMADAQVFLPSATYEADVAAFMTKWMDDIIDAQRADGAYYDVAPAMKGLSYGTPAWGDAGVIVPWAIYQAYGDTRILEHSIGSMTRWVEWCRGHSTGLIRDKDRGNDYGDWLAIGADTPKDLIGTAYFAHAADIVARANAVLGREEEARASRRLFDEVRGAFQARYLRSDGTLAGETQCAIVLALEFDLLPEAARAGAMERLVRDIEGRGNRLSTGFVGVSHLLTALDRGGRADVAHALLLQDQMPSWLFSVKHGATTIWERWNGWTPEGGPHPDASMNSFNHYSLGSCGRYLYEGVAGIVPDAPGFAAVTIRPRITPDLSFARAKVRTMAGEVESDWRRGPDGLRLRVKIPANTRARVVVPCPEGAEIREGGKPVAAAGDAALVSRSGGEATMDCGSGEYVFEVGPTKAP